jgi:hypothetical protein
MFGSFAFGEQLNQNTVTKGGFQVDSTTCASSFTSGTEHGLTQFCVIANGSNAGADNGSP